MSDKVEELKDKLTSLVDEHFELAENVGSESINQINETLEFLKKLQEDLEQQLLQQGA
jgi:hypothetical protein